LAPLRNARQNRLAACGGDENHFSPLQGQLMALAKSHPTLTFGIPLRSTADPARWTRICELLTGTVQSIYSQTDPSFRIILACSRVPEIGVDVDERFELIRLEPLADGSYRGGNSDAGHKRWRIAREFLDAGPGYLMFVDADDLVSKRLVEFVKETQHPFGYLIEDGYALDLEQKSVLPIPGPSGIPFHQICGTSVILRLEPGDMTARRGKPSRFKRLYRAGHPTVAAAADDDRQPLSIIPFPAACYVIGTGVSQSDIRAVEDTDFATDRQRWQLDFVAGGRPASEIAVEFGLKAIASAGQSQNATSPMVSICIATHKRPAGLTRLLESLTRQIDPPPFEAILVDNDAGGSARPVAENFSERLGLKYLVEPERGLARVRNRAVAASTGRYVAFIDDDEWASESWLSALWRMATQHDADAVIGPVIVEFDPAVPKHIRECSLFHRAGVSDGKPVAWYHAHTSNSLVRRLSLPNLATPFDTFFDFTGGEDSDLFFRMVERGARIVGAAHATVFEYRPSDRADLAWVWKRSLRNGNNRIALEWKRVRSTRRLTRTVRTLSTGFSEAFRTAAAWRRDRRRAMRHFIRMADHLGQLWGVLGFKVNEYKVHR
jgi:succinoglycan biosynthesis protein ExoM